MLSAYWNKLKSELDVPPYQIELEQRNRVMLGCVELGIGYSLFFVLGCVALYGFVPTYLLAIAGVMIVIEATWKISLVNKYRGQTDEERSNPAWRRVIWLGGLYTGIFFGLASLTMLLQLPIPNLTLLGIAYMGVYITSCWLGSVYLPTAVSKLIPMTIPLAIAMAIQGTLLNVLFALALVFTTGISLFYIRNLTRQSTELVSARLRIEDLYEKLSVEKHNADQAVIDKSRFIAAASHDLRQPLHALGLFLEAIRTRTTDKEIQSLMDSVDKSTGSLNHLFEGLLDVSKLDAGAIEPHVRHFGINAIFSTMEDEFNQLANAKGLELSFSNDNCVVCTDFILLERVLRNLLSNAIAYTEYGQVSLKAIQNKNEVSITISDTGIGIPETELDNIFSEFHQLGESAHYDGKGFGLGLAIVKRISDLLKFNIQVASSVGEGTRIELSLPAGDHHRVSEAMTPTTGDLVRPGTRILFIDDNTSILEGMKSALADWDVESLLTNSYAEAVQSMDELKFTPDLIIADYHLAENDSGVSAALQIRERLSEEIPFIVVTGDTSIDSLPTNMTPAPPILYKPVRPEKLREAIVLHAR